jgi:D-serine deaminase-like pyridoxal phosphate-dependent protein
MSTLGKRRSENSIRPSTLSRPSRSVPITSLIELETPHAVVDGSRVRDNILRVATYARQHGLNIRPHVKTHKDPEVARMQLEAGATGVTVATAREAEIMAEVTNDILVAFPPVDPKRIDRLMALPEDVELKIALDSLEAITRLSDRASAHKRRVGVLVEMDLGGGRTGVSTPEEVVRLALAARQAPGTEFLGLLVHPGNLRRTLLDPGDNRTWSTATDETVEKALLSMDERIKEAIHALGQADLPCPIVSGGNTPTLYSSHLVTSLTEIRPGTYVYSDRDVASQGVVTWTECAYSILATVVSISVPGQAVIDAGTKAIAKEHLPGIEGFGALLDRPEVVVLKMSEEHGILDLSRTDWRPAVGDRVRVVPNHVCVSVHLQDRIAFCDSGDLLVRAVAARGR